METPLIFWILTGYFRSKLSHIQTIGIFRVKGSNSNIRQLEYHMSKGNFSFMTKVEDPHTVTNYWKRLLREMKEPLIP